MAENITHRITAVDDYVDSTSYYFGNAVAADPATLSLSEDGYLQLGEDFKVSVKELRACIKVMRELARKEYPEDFL